MGLPKDVIEQAQVPLKGLRREWFASGIHKEAGEPGGIVGRVPCPACTSIGLVMLESVDEGIAADIYQCGLCGLTLEGPEEFKAARICVPDDRARLELRRLT
ncbi:hypothetical protein ACIGW3_16055 [Streptomyces sp. NPDC053499]|uniref:hypothetical protein n=1 Tax=Streptomyces sp. NPDC053499 TaxID=3365707 RepID=UPI0037D6026E